MPCDPVAERDFLKRSLDIVLYQRSFRAIGTARLD
jgi:hypothetical protein